MGDLICGDVLCLGDQVCDQGTCVCPPGTELDVTGLICLDVDVDLCLDIICTGGTCDQGTCVCPPGTELDVTGLICLDIDVDLCLDIICTGGTCDQGTCVCPPGTE